MPEGSVSNKMIICIDIGNTNIKYAIYEGETLCISFRVATDLKKTSDEYGSQLVNMLKVREIKRDGITGGIISSVVPSLDYTIERMCHLYLGIEPLRIEPGLKSGLNIRCDDAREVGADRIVNCVSAIVKYGEEKPMIVIDFGTATTFNIINENNEFIGGVIAPRIKKELKAPFTKTIATGGFSQVISKEVSCIDVVDKLLTLEGLKYLYYLNRPEEGGQAPVKA